MSKPLIFLVRDDFPQDAVQLLKKHFVVDSWQGRALIPRESLLERVKGAFGLMCTHDQVVDGELVDASGGTLKVVSTFSVGYDHFKVSELQNRGVKMGHTPGVLTEATAEMGIALLLATGRRLIESRKIVCNNLWKPESWTPFYMCGQGLAGSTVGIIGCGRIGLSVAKKLKSFDIKRLLYYSRSEKPEASALGGELTSVDDLMKESDFIIISISLNADTRHIVNKERINFMKPNAIIVNIGRGGLIDQAALVAALTNKKIGGAGLDVTDPEPIEANDPLIKLNNVVISPHIGSATFSARNAMADLAARNIIAVLERKRMPAEII